MSIDRKCNSCGTELRADETECPVCGAKSTVSVAPEETEISQRLNEQLQRMSEQHEAWMRELQKELVTTRGGTHQKLFCGNCGKPIEDKGDKYCRLCGASTSEAKYLPVSNTPRIIYGPLPKKRTHVCTVCGYTWEKAVISLEKFCPKCGGPVTVTGHGII